MSGPSQAEWGGNKCANHWELKMYLRAICERRCKSTNRQNELEQLFSIVCSGSTATSASAFYNGHSRDINDTCSGGTSQELLYYVRVTHFP